MDENRKNTIEVEMTEDDWMELLQVCIDLRVTPDTLIESFCWEVIRQQLPQPRFRRGGAGFLNSLFHTALLTSVSYAGRG